MIKFTKYHALGNDYLVIDPRDVEVKLDTELIKTICHRNFGVGSDGILYGPIFDHTKTPQLKIFNPDGSEAEKSGNGIRIFSRYLHEHYPVGKSFSIKLKTDVVWVEVLNSKGSEIKVNMGEPKFASSAIPVNTSLPEFFGEPIKLQNQSVLTAYAVSMGNPHCVIPVDNLTPEIAQNLGPIVESNPLFTNKTNVQFAKQIDVNNIAIEIWERGAGYTLASGSSSCAVAAVFKKLQKIKNTVTIKMPGGNILIEFDTKNQIWMTGSVARVFEGVI